ncbi:MAG: head GIN domain-containing protein [Lacibacter sp.]
MKQLFLFALGFLALLGISRAQQSIMVVNDANAELRNTGNFQSIVVSHAIDLVISQGNENAVVVSAAEPAYRDRIKTEVRDGVLRITFEGSGRLNLNKKNPALKAYVSVQQLRSVEAGGACNVKVNGTLRSEELKIKLSGASQFKGEVQANSLKVVQSGASTSKINGRVTNLDVQVTGASDFNGFDLVADNGMANASGASDIKVTVNKDLKVYCSGASDVQYMGAGVISEFRTSGASSIRKREQK